MARQTVPAGGRAGTAREGPRRRRSVPRPLLCTLLVLGTVLLVVGGRRSPLTSIVEVLAAIAILVGMAVALGVFDGNGRRRGRAGPARPTPPVPSPVAAVAQACLDDLDRIEHRRLELGEPWPQVVVGPTGVVLVEVCGTEGLAAPPGDVVARAPVSVADRCPRCGAARTSTTWLREVVAGIPGAATVPVRSVVLVASAAAGACGDQRAGVAVLPADRLADELARGPVLPMATVDAVFAGLARQLSTTPGLVR